MPSLFTVTYRYRPTPRHKERVKQFVALAGTPQEAVERVQGTHGHLLDAGGVWAAERDNTGVVFVGSYRT